MALAKHSIDREYHARTHATPRLSLIWVLLLLFSSATAALWMPVPLEKLVVDNPLIVRGEIVKVTAHTSGRFGVAHLRIERVLKNTLADRPKKRGDVIRLRIPTRRGRVRKSTDLHYARGYRDIWLLVVRDGFFEASNPGDRQNLEKEAEIVEMIDQLEANAPRKRRETPEAAKDRPADTERECLQQWAEKALQPGKDYKPGAILVGFPKNMDKNYVRRILGKHGLTLKRLSRTGAATVAVRKGTECEWICKLVADPVIRFAEPNYIARAFGVK